MKDDQRMVALLSECLAELDQPTPTSADLMRFLLAQVEETAPGQIEAMAARLQLRRLGMQTAH
ncbi:MAG TPA: hypothetical protein VN018_00505 [Brevundimonas sp.]|nr:hypothetical protein [Brevundimonas sp.]